VVLKFCSKAADNNEQEEGMLRRTLPCPTERGGETMSHTVLLVDDEPHLLAALQRALRKEPYTIITATSARDGWVILQGRLIDLVISDQDMPEIPGTVFLAQVRKTFPDVVRFMLTGKATVDIAMQAINAGAISRFFTKPYNHADLAAIIRQALQQKDLLVEAKSVMRFIKHQSEMRKSSEHRDPGLTTVQHSHSGTIIAEPETLPIEEIVRQLRRDAANTAIQPQRYEEAH
jgi:two-component system, probable response regulator PhcQ